MGYRHHLYLVSKNELNKIKNMTNSDLYIYTKSNEEDNYWSVLDLFRDNHIYNMGEIDTYMWKILEKNRISKIFEKEEVLEKTSDYDKGVLNSDGFFEIIKGYIETTKRYYENLLLDNEESGYQDEKTKEKKQEEHIKSKIHGFEGGYEFNFNINDKTITDSWTFEYSIFELLRIWKTIDWGKNYVCYIAY